VQAQVMMMYTNTLNWRKFLCSSKSLLKGIAETYSVGKLVSDSDPFFAEQLTQVTVNIIEKYGNSSNQR
jgi:hypothetical protein